MDDGYPAGGSRALVRVLEEAGGYIYADFLRYYGVDLQDLVKEEPTLSPKRAMALLEGLPPESRTSAHLRDDGESYGWATSDYLLAAIANSVREGTFVNMQVRTKKKLAPIEPIEVPGTKKTKSKPVNNFVRMAQAQLAKTRS